MIKVYAKVSAGFSVYSDVEFFSFPGGEHHLKPGPAAGEQMPTHVVVSGSDVNDYLKAALWIDYAKRQGAEHVAAHIPYLPAARADRGEPFGALVYANLINAMGADEVICFDPHSPVMPALINNLKIVSSAAAIAAHTAGRGYVGIIAPDAGAVQRATDAARAMELPVIRASKVRDFATGKLTGFACEDLPNEGRLLVVDDICDGGGTFRGLAAATGLGPERLDLWVSHGIFSKAAGELRNHYGAILTTDSHPGHTNPEVNADIAPISSIFAN
ncbi:phosphoribosyltransferase family protein [Glutamicibacter sp. NPDC087344]|uniref:phosphoribosyltransferase family protein n=1 Tax=Glutamicibacter sp. NPDC087344 TaxID=3363994 RepID=UPI00381CF5C2